MTATGLYLSGWSTLDEAKFVREFGGLSVDFLIIRAQGAGKIDRRFRVHQTFAEKQGIPWGADMYLGYAPGCMSGLDQAKILWETIEAGGRSWQLPPEIDVEHQPREYDASGRVKSYWQPEKDFLARWLEPAVKYLQDKLGYAPMIYCSPRIIKEWFSANYSKTPPEWLLGCPLHIAHYGVAMPQVRYWLTWAFWQSSDTMDWKGLQSVCLERFNGTKEELDNWLHYFGTPQQTQTVNLEQIILKLEHVIAELREVQKML